MRPPFSRPTAPAGSCWSPITRAAVRRCSASRPTARSARRPRIGWRPRSGRTRSRPIRSNRFAYVPHISRVQDNVLEPPKNIPGPNVIMQFRFDARDRTPQRQLATAGRAAGSRRSAPLLFSPEPRPRLFLERAGMQRHVVSDRSRGRHAGAAANDLDAAGRVRRPQHVLADPSDPVRRGSSMSAIAAITASPGSAVAPDTGLLTPAGHASTEPVPSAFCLDPEGTFLFAAGTASGRLASYRIDGESGALTPAGGARMSGRARRRSPRSPSTAEREGAASRAVSRPRRGRCADNCRRRSWRRPRG